MVEDIFRTLFVDFPQEPTLSEWWPGESSDQVTTSTTFKKEEPADRWWRWYDECLFHSNGLRSILSPWKWLDSSLSLLLTNTMWHHYQFQFVYLHTTTVPKLGNVPLPNSLEVDYWVREVCLALVQRCWNHLLLYFWKVETDSRRQPLPRSKLNIKVLERWKSRRFFQCNIGCWRVGRQTSNFLVGYWLPKKSRKKC